MKILILRIGRMGDMVMVLPAIQAIQQRYPKAKLYAITSVDGMRLLPLIGLDVEKICVYRSRLRYRWSDAVAVKQWLSQHRFDHIFCFESKKRSVAWLPETAHIVRPQEALQHYASRCLQLITKRPEASFLQAPQAYLPVLPTYRLACDDLLKAYGITSDTILVGLHPSYSGYGKWGWDKRTEHKHRLWPVEHFARLALKLSDYAKQHGLDLKLVMNLLPQEQRLGTELMQKSGNTIIALSGLIGFQSYLAFIQRLNVVIVANTGVMHLAAALNTPVVALFSGYLPGDCGPYMAVTRQIVLRAEDMPEPARGLQAIGVTPVFQATLKLLEGCING